MIDDAAGRLVTREVLLSAIERALTSHSAPCGLLVVNVDGFKANSVVASSHDPDQHLMDVVAERLRLGTRLNDVVCHLGGDQFAVLFPSPATHGLAVATAERVIALLSEPVELARGVVATSISIGIAMSAPASSVESLLTHADEALATARTAGRHQYAVFDHERHDGLERRSRLEGELQVALAGDKLHLHFQPEVDLVTGEVVAVEALVRWTHPTLGLLAADRFVDLAEESGMVVELGRWVLETACESLASWSTMWPDLDVRVNVSAVQLGRQELVEQVKSALNRSGLSPERLCLEITETAVMDHVQHSVHVLTQLAGLGTQIALDDFGTGFSSLGYIKRFPVGFLKIDQSFVADIGEPDGRAIVGAVMVLAEALSLDVIAEGVETSAQREVLVELGCRRAQGHLFAPAMPEAELLEWISEQRK